MRVVFLYHRPRTSTLEEVRRGLAPDNDYYGLTYMEQFGIDAIPVSFDQDVKFRSRSIRNLNCILMKLLKLPLNLNSVVSNLFTLNNVDLVFATSDSVGLVLGFLKGIRLLKTPVAYATIGLSQQLIDHPSQFGKKFASFAIKSVDKVICYGSEEANELSKLLSIDKNHFVHVPFGIDTAYFDPQLEELINCGPVGDVLVVGGNIHRDWDTLFKAASLTPEIKYEIVTFRVFMVGRKIPGNVSVNYELPIKEVRCKMSRCRFMVVPTKDVAYGAGQGVLLQGMSMAKLVVMSSTRGQKSYDLYDGKNCFLIPPEDHIALKQAVERACQNSIYCNQIGREARRTVLSKYSTRNYSENLSRIFKSIVYINQVG